MTTAESKSPRPPDFAGLVVAALESRRGEEMARLIQRYGGVPHVSPSMREVPLEENRAAVDFAHRLITGDVDAVILTTGVGTRHLLAQIERHVDRQRFLDALSDVVTIARGPKPVAVLKEWKITPTLRAPEPNTWREVLTAIDQRLTIANQVVAVQEYGASNPSLVAGLEARGAQVLRVKVYQWGLPEDTGPLEENIRRLAAGEVAIVLFTSANQVVNLVHLAEKLQLGEDLRAAMRRTVVGSIGPTTSEMLQTYQLPADFEPTHGKMGQLVREAAGRGPTLLQRKRELSRIVAAPQDVPRSAAWDDSPFMRACRRQPTPFTPVWLMRQAGRYMPEYRAVRAKVTFLELCRDPVLASEVMCTAVEKIGVDAAIIFSDLLPILEPMGMELEFTAGGGPVIHNPLRDAADVDRMLELQSVEALHYVVETVRQTRADLPEELPLIGFAGAPFTLASYAIEGGASRSYTFTKTLMYRDVGAWQELMQRLVRAISLYLNAQIAAGAQAVQIFDSWVGCLGVDDYRTHVLPFVRQLIEQITPHTPVIHFATGNPALLPLLAEAGGDVIGVDWRVPLDEAWKVVGHDRAVQGNLEPAVLLAPRNTIRRRAEQVLRQAAGRPGHIFNLGHGVLPQTPPENAAALVEMVHELSQRGE